MKRLLIAATAAFPLGASALSANATPFDFTYTGSLVTFVVPATDSYQILAFGAQGGASTDRFFPNPGGRGAEIGGDFSLTAGETLQIAVGGAGMAGGGGGGSFVVGPSGAPLVIAGGGGGGGVGPPVVAGGGGLTGPDGGGVPGGGGTGGNGGAGCGNPFGGGGGGGGFFTAGGDCPALFSPASGGGAAFPSLAGGLSGSARAPTEASAAVGEALGGRRRLQRRCRRLLRPLGLCQRWRGRFLRRRREPDPGGRFPHRRRGGRHHGTRGSSTRAGLHRASWRQPRPSRRHLAVAPASRKSGGGRLHLGVGAVLPDVENVFRVSDVAFFVPGQGTDHCIDGHRMQGF